MTRTSLHHIQAKERRRSSMGIQFIFLMVEAQSNWSLSLSRVPGPIYHKTSHMAVSGLRFQRSTYGWKVNYIKKPLQVVSHPKPFGINRNHRNKSASRICQGAVTPSFAPLDCVSCLGPLGARLGVLHDPRVFINNHRPSIRVWVLLRLICWE